MNRASIAILSVGWLAAAYGAVCHASAPSTAVGSVHAPAPLPALDLPAGGDDFRRALLGWMAAPAAPAMSDRLQMPVEATRLSSRFGVRRDPMGGGMRSHLGVDIPDRTGAPVRAAAGGLVVFAGWSRGYGNLVQIDHGGASETRYGHLSGISVVVGDRVPQGAVIGVVGSTGRSTGPHLHFEVRQDGRALDPLMCLGQAIAQSLPTGTSMEPLRQRWDGFGGDANVLPQSRLR